MRGRQVYRTQVHTCILLLLLEPGILSSVGERSALVISSRSLLYKHTCSICISIWKVKVCEHMTHILLKIYTSRTYNQLDTHIRYKQV